MSVGVSTFMPFTHDSVVDCDLPFVNFIKSPSVMLLVFMNLGSKCIIGALVLSRMRSTPSLRPRTLSQYFVLGISSGMIRASGVIHAQRHFTTHAHPLLRRIARDVRQQLYQIRIVHHGTVEQHLFLSQGQLFVVLHIPVDSP